MRIPVIWIKGEKMLCYKCGKREATVKVMTDYKGNPSIRYYCKQCYDEHKIENAAQGGDQPLKCPVCGKKWSDIEESMYLGCVQCVRHGSFRPKIDFILNKTQGASVHTGKSIDDVLVEDKEAYVAALEKECGEAAESGNGYLSEQLRLQLRSFRERNGL